MIKIYKFSEIFSFQKKSKIKAGDGSTNGVYPFFTSSPVLSKRYNEFQFEDEGLIFGTGGLPSIHFCNEKFSVSTDCLVALPKIEVISKFVYYFLLGNIWILEKGFKGAGLKHISKTYISDIKILLPSIEEQKRIVKELDQADELRQKRKQSVVLLDEYLKSVFLEMFGSSAKGFEQWEDVKMYDLAKKEKGSMRTGPFGSDLKHSEFVDEGIAVIGIDNAVQNKFAWDQRRYITQEKYKKLKRYTLFPDDVIITIMGTTGRSAVIPGDIPLCINTKHLAAITLDRELANPYFISYSIHSNPLITDQINRKNRGAIMAGLNLGIIKDLKLKRPPVELQNRFEQMYKKVKALKLIMFTQSKELDTNFNALMQGAFSQQ